MNHRNKYKSTNNLKKVKVPKTEPLIPQHHNDSTKTLYQSRIRLKSTNNKGKVDRATTYSHSRRNSFNPKGVQTGITPAKNEVKLQH